MSAPPRRDDQRLSRRRLLVWGTAGVVTAVAGPSLTPGSLTTGRAMAAGSAPGPFALGVTSGDPDAASAVLWTRLLDADGSPWDVDDVEVEWEVTTDPSFATVTASGTVTARAAEAHSVHVVASLVAPSWYRFRFGDATSPVGFTQPTPADASELRLAAASCQHLETGFYAAHRDIADWQPDLVVFLGDFIYEDAGSPIGGGRVRTHRGDEARTLGAYRDRYAQYLGDADLQRSRAAAPWLVVWDDNEVASNYAGLVPQRREEADDFAARRLAAYQAWWEHMPVRMPRPERTDDLTIFRRVDWGALATVVLIDGRQYRDDQACGDVTLSLAPPCAEALEPDRTMLGREQERWLGEQLASSGGHWTVLGQQTVLSDLRLPNGAIINYDQWDGYGPARERVLAQAATAERVVVLTGDLHVAGVGRLPGVGAEFVTTSISSNPPDLSAALVADIGALFPSMVAAEVSHRGYTRHTVTNDAWVADYRIVADAADPASAVTTWRRFAVTADRPDDVLSLSAS